jgi:hypothetical protein
MAHFAELGKDNIVKRVIVVNNSDCIKDSIKTKHPNITNSVSSVTGKTVTIKISGKDEAIEWEDESKGATFCNKILGGRWVQTSYNRKMRKHYAGIGFTYDEKNDVFIPPQPFKSWKLDKHFDWQPPTPMPTFDGENAFRWNEEKQAWEQH